MEVFITILSTVIVQLGICVFCFYKKQSEVSDPVLKGV
jgi:hypothetical protein